MPALDLPDPTRFTPFFSYRGGELHCEGVAVSAIARAVGTPAYLYSRGSIEAAYRRIDRALAPLPHALCYSVKANSNLAVLRLFSRLGSGFDIVSGGELERLARIGVPGRRIVFSGVGKTREEIRAALRARIFLFNVESSGELELLASEAARVGRAASAAIRINPDIEAGGHPHIATGHRRHKFGVDWSEARRLYLIHRNARWLRWQGIGAHIGSQILELAPFRRALARLAGHYRELSRAGIVLPYFDFGGGLGIRYVEEAPPDLRRYARLVISFVRPLGCRLLLEPGRALVGPAGILLTRVLYAKRSRGKRFVVVDAAMNDMIRPALYGAAHSVTAALKRLNAPVQRADIVGPVCETGDRFLADWPLGEVRPGDLLILWGAGAYGFVAASNYNSRPRPCEVLVEGSRFRLIRRRESFSDLVRGESAD